MQPKTDALSRKASPSETSETSPLSAVDFSGQKSPSANVKSCDDKKNKAFVNMPSQEKEILKNCESKNGVILPFDQPHTFHCDASNPVYMAHLQKTLNGKSL